MEKTRFPWGRTFLVGFGFFGISILWPVFNQWVPLILQAGNPEFNTSIANFVGFGLGPALAMFIMTWDKSSTFLCNPGWATAAITPGTASAGENPGSF